MTDKICEEIMNSIKNKLNETEIFKTFSFGILENIDILSTNNYFFYRTMKTLYVFLSTSSLGVAVKPSSKPSK